MKLLKFLIISIFFLSTACAPVRTVIPLDKNETRATASFGGPLVAFSGVVIPVPLTSINVSRGITENLTVNAGLHTTSLMFGTLQLESSATTSIWKNDERKLGVTASPGFYFMTGLSDWESKFYPMLDLNFYIFPKSNQNYAYCSLQQLFELSSVKAFEQKPDSRYIPSFASGYTISREKMNYTFEIKYMSFLQSNENIVVDYISPGKKGALGIQFGITKKF
jgi:hypothetical protein